MNATKKHTREGCYDAIVVGSGPGGAITAYLLAQSGQNVLLIEEGNVFKSDAFVPFSLEEINKKYRDHGYNILFGKPNIPYVEGCCVGGGSEINSGLYHRTPDHILHLWETQFGIHDISSQSMGAHFIEIENDLKISRSSIIPPSSQLIYDSAIDLGWHAEETQRWVSNAINPTDPSQAIHRRSMSKTYIPKFVSAGGQLRPNTKVARIGQRNNRWYVNCTEKNDHQVQFSSQYLFLCAGAIQTPFILQKSGIKTNIGMTLKCHPMLKVVAKFPEKINDQNMGVPMHQVTEFLPEFILGCSISTLPFLALGLIHYPNTLKTLISDWHTMAIYHITIHSETNGKIHALPGIDTPLIRYNLTKNDLALLSKGYQKITRLLLNANASHIYFNLKNHPIISSSLLNQNSNSNDLLTLNNILLSTVHVMGSCPMGFNSRTSATDSFGKVHNVKNLFINDSSLFPSSIGVNPQGTVMALARRNVLNFINQL